MSASPRCAVPLSTRSQAAGATLSEAVIGVMVAVALMPPLVVCEILLGDGQVAASAGAMLLTVANVICVNLAGVGTFLIQNVRPKRWWEAKRAQIATRRAVAIWIVLLLMLILSLWLNQDTSW